MPAYDFKCPSCGSCHEKIKAISKCDEIEYCPKCGKEMVKQIGAPTFVLNGGGWYKDSYQK